MKNTSIKLTSSTSSKLLKILNEVPENERDATWRELIKDVQKIVEIWSNLDMKKLHVSKIRADMKNKHKNLFYA